MKPHPKDTTLRSKGPPFPMKPHPKDTTLRSKGPPVPMKPSRPLSDHFDVNLSDRQ